MVSIQRPSERWRHIVESERADVAAGRVPEIEAAAIQFWPPRFIAAVDAALARFEQDVAALDPASDAAVLQAVERVVLALNEADHPEGLIESGERDELIAFIQRVLTLAGVDVHALLKRRGSDELTSPWRTW
ncbi:hypothetical protein [Actinoplanes sp. NPDC023714]|uniref:hypothetical protein n=1 Tax=Actinoplanes sp. NPDC023714 TaxID=3154322 RepID=UPI0033D30B74